MRELNDGIDEVLWEKSMKESKKVLDDVSTFGGRRAHLTILQLALYNFATRAIKESHGA